MKGHCRFKKKVIALPLSRNPCEHFPRTPTSPDNSVTMQIFQISLIFYLRNCSIAVEPLVPGRPSSHFPPLPRTGLRPFLLLFLLLPKSFSCVFVWRKWSQNTGGDIISCFSLFRRRWSPQSSTPGDKFNPDAVNFPARSSSPLLQRPRSVSRGRRGFKKTTVYLPCWV